MTALFGPSFTSEDSELMNFLTAEHSAFLEGLWEKFRRYLKSAEEIEFRDLEAQPHPRIWEMYLRESFPLPTLVSMSGDGRRNYQRVSKVSAFR